MPKNNTTGRKAPNKSKTVRERAQAIIADANRYDADTRDAIRNALSRKDADLAEYVTRAEQGETILDLAEEQAKAERGAAAAIAFYDRSDVPDFLTEAVMDALIEAAKVKGVDIWEDFDKATIHFSAPGVARLFTLAGTMSLRAHSDSAEAPTSSAGARPHTVAELAGLISAVLNHPLTPPCVHDDLWSAVNGLAAPDSYYSSASYIEGRLAAVVGLPQEGGGDAKKG